MYLPTFDKRLKKVNRARVVNQAGLGGPVFKSRQSGRKPEDPDIRSRSSCRAAMFDRFN
jgi:hypothetical protein